MAAEKTSSRGQAWFCTTGLPSDIVVEVDDMTFHLHKFPLMSKSRRLHQLITEQETSPTTTSATAQAPAASDRREGGDVGEVEGDEIEEVHCHITLQDFPGGSETFEMAAKFCYGVKIDLSALNVAPLRCAGEFLEMTEEYSEDNLISKTERFLSQSVLKSLKDSIRALRSCERVTPLAESLEIPQRCVEAIVAKASSADPSLFGWPVGDGANLGRGLANQALWNGIDTNNRRKRETRGNNVESWLEDLSLLSLSLFKLLISAMREADLSSEIVEICLMHYAKRYIPGVSRSSRKPPLPSSSSSVPSESKQRELLETIITNLPPEKTTSRSSAAATTRFLFGLLRTSIILNASQDCRASLERKVGLQLEEATLDDLLIPSYSYLNETLYDVDCVERILGHFLDATGVDGHPERSPALMLVGKLIDGYLSEIASDANLKPEKFYSFAISLPEQARLFDDGLYRAVDVYLKAHPWISEAEREKICGLIDCQKLTLEACTHAAQNERLPLRVVVQVLFFEQLQLRHAIAGTLLAAETGAAPEPGRKSASRLGDEEEDDEDEDEEEDAEVVEQEEPVGERAVAVAAGQGSASATWRAAVRENQVLRLDMDSMRTRVHQLERECSTMKKAIEKIDSDDGSGGRADRGWRGSLTRKFGCKFKTQVCDSHEPAVVDTRKGRHRHRR
ncbi:NPH3 domain-containing protein [Psidium guajava]|nr:NPH3 domain-containing protein [Psidium guajava]